MTIRRWLLRALCALCSAWSAVAPAADAGALDFVDSQITTHAGKTGLYVLETGTEALLARAWLVENARHTIEVQYFIWSSDNIGILAAEALLRAAGRGVKVRVIVDDLLIDAPDRTLLALALHPNIEIRIYNPQTSVGVPLPKRVLNILSNFRGFNQRMHDKTFIVDGRIAVTGGRNMAAEYFDYNHQYNFRDRDALVLGAAVQPMRANFEAFWRSELAVPVEQRFEGLGLFQKNLRVGDAEVQQVYRELHAYAKLPENFAPEVRAAIADTPSSFARLARQMRWGEVAFIHDRPGKNAKGLGLGGGGESTSALARLLQGAQRSVVIQSPYLVPSDEALALLQQLRARGVTVRISTNSMASTDNLPAFSGYRNQRERLLAMGVQVHEYKPAPEVQRELIQRLTALPRIAPVFSLHAKTLVVDGRTLYIGTFNFDPRSQNLNTEVGVVVDDEVLARAVQTSIETDMAPGNSWNAATDDPDQHAPLAKRAKVRAFQWLPLRSLL
jgi:putative cardiolipin synthase